MKRVSKTVAATGQPIKVVRKRISKVVADAETEVTTLSPDPVVATVKPVKVVRKRASKVIVAESPVPALEPISAVVDQLVKVAESVVAPLPETVKPQSTEAITPVPEPIAVPLPTKETHLKTSQILAIFRQRWPKLFDVNNAVPFATGIHKDIRLAIPELNWIQLKKAMSAWCCSTRYLRACTEGAVRYGLDGLPNGTVSAEIAANSKQQLLTGRHVQSTHTAKKDALPKPSSAPKPSTQNLPKPKQDVFVVNVKSIKIAVPLKVSELPVLPEPKPNQKQEPVTLRFQCGDVMLSCTLNPKNYRKAIKDAHPDSTAVIQGKLGSGGQILEAGMAVTPPKATDKPVG